MTTQAKLLLLAVLVLLLFALGFWAGYRAHRCPPVAPTRVEQHAEQKQQAKEIDRAPEVRTVTRYETRTVQVPVPGPPGPVVYRTITEQVPVERIVERLGPERIVTQSSDAKQSQLVLTPPPLAPLPGWALGLSLDDVADRSTVRLEVGRRLFGQLWARASIAPLEHQLGVGFAYQF